MRNEKFTKGVWSIADCREIPDADYDYSIVDANGWNIAHVENCSIEEEEANAHLIKAAPKLYKLLKLACYEFEMMANWCEENGMKDDAQSYWNLILGLQAALAEARGE